LKFTSPAFGELPVFKNLPRSQAPTYLGTSGDDFLNFEGASQEDGSPWVLSLLQTIRKEEKLLWESCRQMLENALKTASQGLRGFFGYELLTVDLSGRIERFNPQDFARLLANHSQKMSPGQTRLIQYGAFWGLLTKRVQEDWGKIVFENHVRTWDKLPGGIEKSLKKLARNCMAIEPGRKCRRIVVLDNLGTTPLTDPSDPGQEESRARFLEFFRGQNPEAPVSVFLLNRSQVTFLG
jgi:hypothetical protein